MLDTIEQYVKESIILEGKWSIKKVHRKVLPNTKGKYVKNQISLKSIHL